MAKPLLLMLAPMLDLVQRQLDELFEVERIWLAADRPARLRQIGPRVEAVALNYGAGPVDAALMDLLPRLAVIGNFGVGYDSVDAKAARARGIVVTNTPDVLTEETADTAFGLLLMTVRELGKAEAYLRAGRWPKANYPLTAHSLRDRKIGIAGLGRIGKAIGRRCEASLLPVSYWGRSRQPDVSYKYYADLIEMARDVDTLMVVLPAGPTTQGVIGRDVLEALGPRGIVINVARGSVVDEAALIDALQTKTIAAAGLDVMIGEPNIDPRLIELENAVLLPHVGSASQYTRNAMGQLVVDNLAAFVAGNPPLTPVAETPFHGWRR